MLMLLIIIFGLIAGVILSVSEAKKERSYYHEDKSIPFTWYRFFHGFLRIGLGCLAAAIFAGSVVGGFVWDMSQEDEPRRYTLTSLGDGAGVKGNFFLGSGTVETEPVFFYYAPRSSGGYGLFHEEAWKVNIYEDTTNTGYMLKFCDDATTASEWGGIPFFDFYDENTPDSERYDCSDTTVKRIEFHIPENSIDRSFNLDAS